jgi:hypothetical protein
MKPHGAAPFDRLLAVYNLLMAAIWLAIGSRTAAAPWIGTAHMAAAALPVLLDRAPLQSRGMRFVRHAYPVAWLGIFWSEVDLLRRALHPYAHDAFIRALDIGVFGQPLHATFMASFPSLWVSEPLHFAYFAYYPAIGLPIVALAVQGRMTAMYEMYFRLMLAYLTCFCLFAIFPVDGPQHTQSFFVGHPASGVWYRVVHAVNGVGGSLGAAFPSSHAAGAVSIAYCAWLYFRRPVALLMTLHAGAVVLATFYTQYHYAIDSLAGLTTALVVQLWLAPALLAYDGRPVKLPVLPRVRWPVRASGGIP